MKAGGTKVGTNLGVIATFMKKQRLEKYAVGITGPLGGLSGWFLQGRIYFMKIFRNLTLALIAFAVLAGSVVPASAARHHHHHHHRR
jgi:hypothetical protein